MELQLVVHLLVLVHLQILTGGNIQVGVTGDNEIDTSSGGLTLDSAGGTVTVDDNSNS